MQCKTGISHRTVHSTLLPNPLEHIFFLRTAQVKHGQRTVVGACGQLSESACIIRVVHSSGCYSFSTLTPTYAVLLQAVSIGVPLISSSILGRNIQSDVKNWYACL